MIGRLKIIGWMALGAWLFGAVVLALLAEVERRHDCVKDEGLIKGLFWCKTDTLGRDGGYTKSVINGLRWPFLLLGGNNGKAGPEDGSAQTKISREEFEKSAVGSMYKCYAVAVRADLAGEASIIGRTIGQLRKKDSILDSNHDQFTFYATATIDRIEREANSDFQLFFNYVCREPVSRMQQVLNDGML